eukprot:TRINITY_DN180_c0_g1_i6.p1 TRINITY_DN180_c0_g1~~TRINITY_DN180_c0_g1_i6.p1  ORF type:complete len:248 (+),score=69.29 TRINITY_DN180_c0_g1_i6:65-808(+)
MFKGKGKTQGWVSKGKGKGKGDTTSQDIEKLKTIDASQKVWVGGLVNVTWKQLQDHFNQIGKTIYAAVFEKSSTGCVAYKSAGEVAAAVQGLNGSQLGGSYIEVDYFSTPSGRKGTSKGKSKGKGYSKGYSKGWSSAPVVIWQPVFQKGGKGKGKAKGKHSEIAKLKKMDNSLKVWVGGLDSSVTWKQLEEHFNQAGKTTWATVFSKGTGCVAYGTAEEAQTAIQALQGTTIGTCTIQVDTFDKSLK